MEQGLHMTEEMIRAQEKNEKKERIRARNEPPQLTAGEEIGNAVTHGIGAALALAGMILLLLKSDMGLEIMASCFYGGSLFFMMLMSCLYHSFRSGSAVKRIFRRFDYTSIYLLIGGTFAPLYLVYWGNTLGIVLFCIQWGLIAFGVTMVAVFGPGRFKALHYALYFTIGWSGIIFFPDWYQNNLPLLVTILVGGVVYTVGMVPFAWHKKFSHFVWHLFVLFGAVLHWFGIFFFVYGKS